MSANNAKAIPISGGFVGGGSQEGQIVTLGQYVHVPLKDNGRGFNSSGSVNAYVAGLLYGFTNKLIGFSLFPYFSKNLELKQLNTTFNTGGMGDPVIGLLYKPWAKVGKGWITSIGLTGSIEPPLGNYTKATTPRVMQSGTGNWGVNLGGSWFYEDLMKMAAVNLSYKAYAKGHGYKHSDVFSYNLSLGHRIYPLPLPDGGIPFAAFAQLEFLGAWTGKKSGGNTALDDFDRNTGGNLIKLAPGLKLEMGRGLTANVSYQIPIHQRLNGIQAAKQGNTFLANVIYIF